MRIGRADIDELYPISIKIQNEWVLLDQRVCMLWFDRTLGSIPSRRKNKVNISCRSPVVSRTRRWIVVTILAQGCANNRIRIRGKKVILTALKPNLANGI